MYSVIGFNAWTYAELKRLMQDVLDPEIMDHTRTIASLHKVILAHGADTPYDRAQVVARFWQEGGLTHESYRYLETQVERYKDPLLRLFYVLCPVEDHKVVEKNFECEKGC